MPAEHRVLGEVGARGLGVAPGAAAVAHAHFEVRGRRGRAVHVGEEHLEQRDLVGMHEAQHVDVLQLLGPVTEDVAYRRAHVQELARTAHDADDVGDVLDHRLEPLLAAAQLGGAIGDGLLESSREVVVLAQHDDLAHRDREEQHDRGPQQEAAQRGALDRVHEDERAAQQHRRVRQPSVPVVAASTPASSSSGRVATRRGAERGEREEQVPEHPAGVDDVAGRVVADRRDVRVRAVGHRDRDERAADEPERHPVGPEVARGEDDEARGSRGRRPGTRARRTGSTTGCAVPGVVQRCRGARTSRRTTTTSRRSTRRPRSAPAPSARSCSGRSDTIAHARRTGPRAGTRGRRPTATAPAGARRARSTTTRSGPRPTRTPPRSASPRSAGPGPAPRRLESGRRQPASSAASAWPESSMMRVERLAPGSGRPACRRRRCETAPTPTLSRKNPRDLAQTRAETASTHRGSRFPPSQHRCPAGRLYPNGLVSTGARVGQ